jgi:predicted nicotinamide N-methyase
MTSAASMLVVRRQEPPVEPRLRRLERWLGEQVRIEIQDCSLPISGRRYAIAIPDQASKDALFEAARRDPDKQMPHWAKIWPSGVALADIVVEYADQLAGQHILELGAGLGSTASAVLETDASLITADYSLLSLGLCRYNSLLNARRAPRSLRFNWRSPETPALLRSEATGGFRLILAADVLYEGRDVWPLLGLLDRLLAPDGALWLAEPARKTAQRFLDTAAVHGWQGTTRSVYGPWPDGTADRVNVHFLSRARLVDRSPADLGGWRI